jgi:translation initiation factor IF-1
VPEAALEVPATVREALPGALYRVEVEGDARTQVTAHVSGAAAALLRLLPGDAVVVELMPYDMTRGRIVRRRESR